MNIRKRSLLLGGAALSLFLIALGQTPACGDDEGPPPPSIPRIKPQTYYTSLVSTVLPGFSSSMLSVPNGPDWMAGKTIHQVAVAVGDSDPGTIVTSGSVVMGYDPPDGPRRIKLDFSEGYIRYTNRLRSFHIGSPCVAVPSSTAENALVATLGSLSLPSSEWDTRTVDMVVGRDVFGEAQDPTPEYRCEIERMVTIARKAANGYPIFDSWARESVSNLGERARLLIDWPRFVMQTGLIMRSRDEVIQDMGRKIWESESNENGLGAEIDLEIRLGYARTPGGFVPVARAAFADTYQIDAGEVLDVPLAFNPNSGIDPDERQTSVRFRAWFDPVGGTVTMDFYLPATQRARLAINDVSGREVAIVTDAEYPAGWHQIEWDARDGENRRLPAGVYFARLVTAAEAPTRKVLVVR